MSSRTTFKILRQTTGSLNKLPSASHGEVSTRIFSGRFYSTDSTGQTAEIKDMENTRDSLLRKSCDLLVDQTFVKGEQRSTRVMDFKRPEELKELMDFSIGEAGIGEKEVLGLLQQTVDYSLQSASPRFFNQLYAGRNVYGLAAALLVEGLNTNVHTYETAPVFSMAEMEVLKAVCNRIGYQDGEGIFMSGGSLCNMMGFHMARYRHDNLANKTGMYGSPRLVIFAAANAHYSVRKGASFLGFGTDSIVPVAEDDRGRMIPAELSKAVQQVKDKGDIPLCALATSGTTVLGSFDPLEALADICETHGIWLHVDACWGGGVLFSDTHRRLLQGIERADSVSISFHKLVGAPLQCAALMTRHRTLLKECNSTTASYLFQTDKQYYEPAYDLGNLTIQCGRKADGYKFWMLWKALGHKGINDLVDKFFDQARYFMEKLKATDGFRLVLPEFEYVNISFWYIPPSMRGQPETAEWWQRVGKVAPRIKERMVTKGSLAVGYQPQESMGLVNFFRIIIDNPNATQMDLDFAMEEIHELGKDL